MTTTNNLPVSGRGSAPADELNIQQTQAASAVFSEGTPSTDPSGELNPRRPQQYDGYSYSTSGDSYVGAFGLF